MVTPLDMRDAEPGKITVVEDEENCEVGDLDQPHIQHTRQLMWIECARTLLRNAIEKEP